MEDDKDWQSGSSRSSDAEFTAHNAPRRRALSNTTRLHNYNPLRLLPTNFSYHRIPSIPTDGFNGSSFAFPRMPPRWSTSAWADRWRDSRRPRSFGKLSLTRTISLAITSFVLVALLAGGGYHHHRTRTKPQPEKQEDRPYYWMHYLDLDGYYQGVRTLVPYSKYVAQNGYNKTVPLETSSGDAAPKLAKTPPMDPVPYRPYPDFRSRDYLRTHHSVQTCYLDPGEKIQPPDVYAYPGLPQHMPEPSYGSFRELGLEDKMCFDRFGRLGPYGYGYNESEGGLGLGIQSESTGSEKVFQQSGHVDYTNMDWGTAQKRCTEKNSARFHADESTGKQRVKRHAYVLRTWSGYEYTPHQILTLRAMITELNLKSGGEYDVHFLVHIKNNSIPIWADEGLYNKTLQENVPREFWNISTLWSEQQMMMYYPGPFGDNFANLAGSEIHGVYRSPHFAMQWFSRQHPEYDFYWNWEMDLRYFGHYWEFNNVIGEWAKKQPRKGLWERGRRFYIPQLHGTFDNFTKFVERETVEVDIPANAPVIKGPVPIWGPVRDFENSGMLPAINETIPPTTYDEDNYEWGVGEDADLLVFNPLFEPSSTNWVFRDDTTGYDHLKPIPPRRAAIITVARLSKRLLDTMHEETWRMKHTMFPEMWPPTACLHHGLKAVYVPHPVYFDRDWDIPYMDQIFNYPKEVWDSPYGWGEHNSLGGSFYYNSQFAGRLWRRWLGQKEEGVGGIQHEEQGTGRMCLRGSLHHPIKHESSLEY